MNHLKRLLCSESRCPIYFTSSILLRPYFTTSSLYQIVPDASQSLLTSDTAHRAPPGRVILLPLLHLALECHDVHNATQTTLEAAWADDKTEVEVVMRGVVYVVTLKGEMKQRQKDDAARWRAVRRI